MCHLVMACRNHLQTPPAVAMRHTMSQTSGPLLVKSRQIYQGIPKPKLFNLLCQYGECIALLAL